MDNFKGKEDPREHLQHLKYSCYIIANDDILMLRIFPMNLEIQSLYWYNNFPQHSIFIFEQLANQFLDHFGINIRKRDSITYLSKLSQFDDEAISDYVSHWRAIIINMPYSLPQKELVKLFFRICNKHISSILQNQRHLTF